MYVCMYVCVYVHSIFAHSEACSHLWGQTSTILAGHLSDPAMAEIASVAL